MMRIAFLGTPDFAVPALAELAAAGHEIAAVYAQPPAPRGRGQAVKPSPVWATEPAALVSVCDDAPKSMLAFASRMDRQPDCSWAPAGASTPGSCRSPRSWR